MFCSVITGLLSMPLGVLQFIPVYHVLHDNYGIHTEVCVLLFFMVYVLIIWRDDRRPTPEARAQGKGTACFSKCFSNSYCLMCFPLYFFDEIALHVFLTTILAAYSLGVVQGIQESDKIALHVLLYCLCCLKTLSIFLYCCPDCPSFPATAVQMGWAIWAVIKKHSLKLSSDHQSANSK